MLPVWHRAPEAIGPPARLAQRILSKVSREVKAQSAKREQRRALQKESVERNRDGAAYLSSLALMRAQRLAAKLFHSVNNVPHYMLIDMLARLGAHVRLAVKPDRQNRKVA